MPVIIGINHVLKRLEWQDHVPNKHNSIREYLLDSDSTPKMLSIGRIIGTSVFEDDFRKQFSGLDDAIALDLDERIVGWKSGITDNIAIKHYEIRKFQDCLLVS
jgi:hypothetical protein